MEEQENRIIAGRNAVLEALRAKQEIDVVYMAEGDLQGSARKIRAMAKEAGLVVKSVSRRKLDEMVPGVNHQGVAAGLVCGGYATLEEVLSVSREKGTQPFLILADEIEDPHNLGAILRTAEACGADGVILPKRRSASLNATVFKTSAGAAGVIKVARVPNLVECAKELKRQNIWLYGADMDGAAWDHTDLTGGVALVIGSEGRGISRLLREQCDFLISLPMRGQINSLNASVAAGILMYEVVRQRG
jgi:23S rRNA (guanosine2251-2'-O)-methyltransferase